MTQSFDEYIEEKAIGNVKCSDCKKFICYGCVCDDSLLLCIDCMKKDHEKNKK